MNRTLWRLAGPVYADIAVHVLLLVLITACHAAQALCLALALSGLFAARPVTELWPWAGGFALAALLRIALAAGNERLALRTAERTTLRLRQRLLPNILGLGADSRPGQRSGEIVNSVVAGVEALARYYSRYIPAVTAALIGCAGVVAGIACFDLRSACIVALCVLALPFTDRLWLRWKQPSASGLFSTMGRFAAFMLDSLQGMATLKAFDAVRERRATLAGHARALRLDAMSVLYAILMRNAATGLLGLGGVALIAAINAPRTVSGTLSPLALLATLLLAREAFRPLDRLDKSFHVAWGAASAGGPIAALLATPPAVAEAADPLPLPAGTDVVFDRVSFRWPGGEAPVLSEVSFALHAGEFVAVVGPSGAGKSTLASLLMRFADPQSGTVRLGGVNLRDLSLRDLRRQVSAVFQDCVLFPGSIEENLRLARPDASRQEMLDAARIAGIHEFIESLPQGYATPVGERGSGLSGGQRQRLAIARAWLKDAPVLVLDEATSSIDVANEQAIQGALAAAAGQRSLLVIAHRLASIEKADRILVLDGGRIVEEGRHEDLLERGGLYARLWAAQEQTSQEGAPA